jgi:hypothetical protein
VQYRSKQREVSTQIEIQTQECATHCNRPFYHEEEEEEEEEEEDEKKATNIDDG